MSVSSNVTELSCTSLNNMGLPCLDNNRFQPMISLTNNNNDFLSKWLNSIDFIQYYNAFKRDGFDRISTIKTITVNDLIDMKMPKGHARVILNKINELKYTNTNNNTTNLDDNIRNNNINYNSYNDNYLDFNKLPMFPLTNNNTTDNTGNNYVNNGSKRSKGGTKTVKRMSRNVSDIPPKKRAKNNNDMGRKSVNCSYNSGMDICDDKSKDIKISIKRKPKINTIKNLRKQYPGKTDAELKLKLHEIQLEIKKERERKRRAQKSEERKKIKNDINALKEQIKCLEKDVCY